MMLLATDTIAAWRVGIQNSTLIMCLCFNIDVCELYYRTSQFMCTLWEAFVPLCCLLIIFAKLEAFACLLGRAGRPGQGPIRHPHGSFPDYSPQWWIHGGANLPKIPQTAARPQKLQRRQCFFCPLKAKSHSVMEFGFKHVSLNCIDLYVCSLCDVERGGGPFLKFKLRGSPISVH